MVEETNVEFRCQLRGAEYTIHLKPEPRPEDSRTYVAQIGDHVYRVELQSAQAGRLHFTVDGRSYEAFMALDKRDDLGLNRRYVALIGGETPGAARVTRHYEITLVAPDGSRPDVEGDLSHHRGAAAGALGARSSLEAQMPGQVVQVMVTEGDQVTVGQPLLVLEAMKMTTRVVAPVEGQVSRVLVREGDTVEYGQRLVEVEPDAGSGSE